MKSVFQTVVFQIFCIILFGFLYWKIKDDFSVNINNDNNQKYKSNMLDYFFTSVTIQSGVGYSILNPNTDRAKLAVIIQQILMISSNILILYLFSKHLLKKHIKIHK
jgi:hypothetical protein